MNFRHGMALRMAPATSSRQDYSFLLPEREVTELLAAAWQSPPSLAWSESFQHIHQFREFPSLFQLRMLWAGICRDTASLSGIFGHVWKFFRSLAPVEEILRLKARRKGLSPTKGCRCPELRLNDSESAPRALRLTWTL